MKNILGRLIKLIGLGADTPEQWMRRSNEYKALNAQKAPWFGAWDDNATRIPGQDNLVDLYRGVAQTQIGNANEAEQRGDADKAA